MQVDLDALELHEVRVEPDWIEVDLDFFEPYPWVSGGHHDLKSLNFGGLVEKQIELFFGWQWMGDTFDEDRGLASGC